jgi:hypothetical protein
MSILRCFSCYFYLFYFNNSENLYKVEFSGNTQKRAKNDSKMGQNAVCTLKVITWATSVGLRRAKRRCKAKTKSYKNASVVMHRGTMDHIVARWRADFCKKKSANQGNQHLLSDRGTIYTMVPRYEIKCRSWHDLHDSATIQLKIWAIKEQLKALKSWHDCHDGATMAQQKHYK